ncbi:sel1 repeat family protein [Streptomyces sp. NWU339]|uniref:sel1 repeat family protein n=1 Tax=Streptomyces sp. NWU339 TaxID=2185284 RepID=UPI0011B6BBFD|nr:sel1 repeat family protein [Streptomyces sp. NWU339]
MAASRMVWGKPDPNLELAAEAGDVGAMKTLGKHLHESPGGLEHAERWLLAAAEAGDHEAMYHLSEVYWDFAISRRSNGDADKARSVDWCRRAARAGWPEAVRAMGRKSGISGNEREFWLRHAGEDGDPWAITSLAELAEKRKRPEDAEHWYRMAIAHGLSSVRTDLAYLLMRQGRLSEAEECVRPEAEAGSVRGAWQLADVLEQLGRQQEASAWRETYEALRAREIEESGRQLSRAAPEFATVAVTALVTTAVVPFVQALVAKAAEDAYGQARSLVRRMLRGNGEPGPAAEAVEESTGEEEPRLLIADDAEAGITLFVWSNASDEALRALSSLDMDELALRRPDRGRVRLVWHPGTGRWRIRGE